ncbi:MAG: hypothetical protein M3349_00375, partial [Actinomycetota bacterium]|nr:hypothetical protein [Actinomycetota bacterium]
MTNLRSYLPDGVLDELCARLVDLDEDARKEVAPHRSVRDVWGYRFGEGRIVAKGYDDADEGR